MSLKEIVDKILKDKKRSLTWLSEQMGRTLDGLRLGLSNESIKYKDILIMADALEVSPSIFFNINAKPAKGGKSNAKVDLEAYKELVQSLKDQLKDKDKIIALLSK